MPVLLWRILRRAFGIYFEIDGDQRAASFGYYAFFSLFPLLLLIVSVGSIFVEPAEITNVVIRYVGSYIPLNEEDSAEVFSIIQGIIDARTGLGTVAILGLFWSATHFFHALVRGVNRAWHTVELDWWKVPLKNLLMVGILASGLLVGILLPVAISMLENFTHIDKALSGAIIGLARYLLPFLVLFYAIAMLYKVSPRRKVLLREVWIGAIVATLFLKALQQLLLFYTNNIWKVNAIYGAMGILVVLLLWVYACGTIIIWGACLCAAQHEVVHGPLEDDAPA